MKEKKILPFEEATKFILEEKKRLDFTYEELAESYGIGDNKNKKQDMCNILTRSDMSLEKLSKLLPLFGWEIKGILLEKKPNLPI